MSPWRRCDPTRSAWASWAVALAAAGPVAAAPAIRAAIACGIRSRRLLENDDDLASLRSDERFAAILRRIE